MSTENPVLELQQESKLSPQSSVLSPQSSTHRAAVLYGHRDIRIERRPTPSPGPEEVLLKVRACTICGSDLHYYDHSMRLPAPMVIGHEFAAEVVALGERVQGVAPGARVAVEPGISCGA